MEYWLPDRYSLRGVKGTFRQLIAGGTVSYKRLYAIIFESFSKGAIRSSAVIFLHNLLLMSIKLLHMLYSKDLLKKNWVEDGVRTHDQRNHNPLL
jgi:hypothetical protein